MPAARISADAAWCEPQQFKCELGRRRWYGKIATIGAAAVT
jgi:hypothetical protein